MGKADSTAWRGLLLFGAIASLAAASYALSDGDHRSASDVQHPSKATVLANMAAVQWQAIVQEHLGAATALPARATPTHDPPPPSGIIHVALPFPASVYDLDQIGWQDVQGRIVTTVYVGAETQHPRHSIVIVARRVIPVPSATPVAIDLNTTTERDTLYRTPGATGALRVVGVKGHVLRLAARDGAVLRFNVDSRRLSG